MKEILLENYKQFTYDIEAKRKSISKEINLLNEKVANARDKYLVDKLDEEDYKEIKRITKSQIEQLEQELQQMVSDSKELDIRTKIENALDGIENLANLYQQGDLQTKRTIGCLIFPQKVEFDGKSFQTPKMNIVAQCIYQYNNGLGNKKPTSKSKIFKCRSCDLDRIQTCNLLSRNQMRYSVAPRGHLLSCCLTVANIPLFSVL